MDDLNEELLNIVDTSEPDNTERVTLVRPVLGVPLLDSHVTESSVVHTEGPWLAHALSRAQVLAWIPDPAVIYP